MEELIDELGQVEDAPMGVSSLPELLRYLEPFYAYISGSMPPQLRTDKKFALSYTSICKMLDNPLRFFEYVVNSKFFGQRPATPAMLVGSIADDYILNRLVKNGELEFVPLRQHHKRNTKAGKEAYAKELAEVMASYPDATVVDAGVYNKAMRVVDSLVGTYSLNGKMHNVNPRAMQLLVDDALQSKWRFSFKCPFYHLPITGEIDVWGKDNEGNYYAADLKSMAAVDNKAFGWAIKDRLLPLQAYIYKLALKEVLGINITSYYVVAGCVDNHSNICKLSSAHFAAGEADYNEGVGAFSDCLLRGAEAFVKSYQY